MQSKEQSFASFDFQEEIKRAKWFKEDLDKGGWREVYKGPVSNYWIKSFPEEKVPIKVLFTYDLPMPAKKFLQLLHPSTQDTRHKWDDGFVDLETLEVYPDGGFVTYMRAVTSWPIKDRSFVLFYSPIKEVDWYGKKAFVIVQKNVVNPSKPEGEDGCVRAYNGGNFFVALEDKHEPEAACKVFGLTNNNYNGWVPNFERVMARIVPRAFNKLQENVIKGYKMLCAKE